jgi:hypothetical protein
MSTFSSRLRLALHAAVILSLSVWGLEGALAQKELKQTDLSKLAQEAIKNKEVAIEPPALGPEGGFLKRDLGNVSFVIDPQSEDFDLLLEVVLKEQLEVEVLRQYETRPERKEFWKPYLARVEEVIAAQLQVLQNPRISEDARFAQILQMRDERIMDIYIEALTDLAKRLGVALEGERAAFRVPRTVRFLTNPGGARVFVVHAVEARIAALRQTRISWRLVHNPNEVQLEGKYHYLIQWPNRTKRGESMVHIDHDGQFLLE